MHFSVYETICHDILCSILIDILDSRAFYCVSHSEIYNESIFWPNDIVGIFGSYGNIFYIESYFFSLNSV